MNYYNDKLKDGKEYENFVVEYLKKQGIEITLTKTFKDQIHIGESLEGYEIKFDDKYQETGNLWIETEERSNINKKYVNSGILRDDNTIFYVIGNYDVIFIFKKDKLKQLSYEKKILENNMRTSKGYLLSTTECYEHSDVIVEINKKNERLDVWMGDNY